MTSLKYLINPYSLRTYALNTIIIHYNKYAEFTQFLYFTLFKIIVIFKFFILRKQSNPYNLVFTLTFAI